MFRARIAAGLEQKDAAARAGISAAHLCRIEKGRCGASALTLRRLASVLNCSIADLAPSAGTDRGAA